jgi:hypothetical protein
LKEQILRESHDSPMERHLEFLKTYQRIENDFLGEGMKKDIQNFVRYSKYGKRYQWISLHVY